MITDRIELHEVLLPINHDHYNFRVKKMQSFFCKRVLIPSIETTVPFQPYTKIGEK